MTSRGSVVVVDGDSGFRSSTERFLRAHGFEVEGYDHPARLLDGPPRDVPTCLLLELSLRGMSGLDVQGELVRRGHLHPLVFMSGRPDVTATVQAMKRGAADVLLKPLERGQLLEAIAFALHRDERERAVRVAQGKARERLSRLTIREQQVCDRLMKGMINKQIAFDLGLAESTVKVHRSRMMEKLGVDSLVAFVRLVDQASGDIDAPGIGMHQLPVRDGSGERMLTSAA